MLLPINTFTIHNLLGLLVCGALGVVFYLMYFHMGRRLLDLLSGNFVICSAMMCLSSFLTDNLVPAGMSAHGWPGGPSGDELARMTLDMHRLGWSFALLLLPTQLHFVHVYCRSRSFLARHWWIPYVVTVAVLPTVWTDLWFSTRSHPLAATSSWQVSIPWMPVAGWPVLPFFLVWFPFEAYLLARLWRSRGEPGPSLDQFSRQWTLVFFAFVAQIGLGLADPFMVLMGFSGPSLIPLGSTAMGALLAAALIRSRVHNYHALAQLEKEKAALLESVDHPLIFLGLDRRVQWANTAATSTLSVVLGEQIRGAITSEECRIIEESWSSQPRRSCEITDELGRTWLVYVSQVRDDWGNMLGLLILRTNITPIRKAEAAIRDVNSKVIYAREQEQQRMARDLHDSAAQSLAALKMRLANTIEQYGPSNRDVVRFLVSVEFGLGKVIRELREICHRMYPSMLEVFGLAKALDGLLDDYRKAGLTCVMDCPAKLAQTRFQPEMEIALYRVAQEAVHNATRHGDANCISVRVRRFEQSLRLEITDDGSGFDPQSVLLHKGLGMKSMASRVEGLGGHLDVQSRPGETTIAIDVPWRVAYGTKAETSVGTVVPTKSAERRGRSPVPPGQGGAQ